MSEDRGSNSDLTCDSYYLWAWQGHSSRWWDVLGPLGPLLLCAQPGQQPAPASLCWRAALELLEPTFACWDPQPMICGYTNTKPQVPNLWGQLTLRVSPSTGLCLKPISCEAPALSCLPHSSPRHPWDTPFTRHSQGHPQGRVSLQEARPKDQCLL